LDTLTSPMLLAQCKALHPLEDIKKEITSLLKVQSVKDFNIHISLPYSYIEPIKQQFAAENIHLGSEILLNADDSCFTASIAGRMVKESSSEFVLIGASQDRIFHSSDSRHLKNKLKIALQHKIIPYVCVGESLQEHQDKKGKQIIIEQLNDCLEGASDEELKNIFIIYNAEWICLTPWEADSIDLKEAYQNFREAVKEVTASNDVSSQQLIVAIPGYSQDVSQLIQLLKNAENPFYGYSLGVLGSSADYLQPLVTHKKADNTIDTDKNSLKDQKNHIEEEENKENENV
jgi:triosephosphate isomerase